MRSRLLVMVCLAALVLPASASALECGDGIVAVGDASVRVLDRCGEPASKITRMESRTVYRRAVPPMNIGEAVTVTVQVDVWVYDFGPSRFLEELTFEDGVLVRTRRLSRR